MVVRKNIHGLTTLTQSHFCIAADFAQQIIKRAIDWAWRITDILIKIAIMG
jgi:hypothetical protein